ncbi:ribosomal protein S5 domain 2-type protein [Cladochytrium replicatum]|nr:ribosomal protein S5 domain 2-type protein [Cladochytrium replicatum]
MASTTTAGLALDAESFRKIHPAEYLRRFLANGVRPDGRTLDAARGVHITVGNISTAVGSATVRLGNTIMVCGVKAEVAEPRLIEPSKGYLVVNVDLPALCSSKFKPGPPDEQTMAISEYLDRVVGRSGVVNLNKLCIASGAAVWVLYADIVCLNYDGNVLDTALIALISALSTVRLPSATFTTKDLTVRVSESLSPLTINRRLVSTTFGVFDNQVLVDLTDDEEDLVSAQLTVVVDDQGNLCGVSKAGGSGLGAGLNQCIAQAKERAIKIFGQIDSAIGGSIDMFEW